MGRLRQKKGVYDDSDGMNEKSEYHGKRSH